MHVVHEFASLHWLQFAIHGKHWIPSLDVNVPVGHTHLLLTSWNPGLQPVQRFAVPWQLTQFVAHGWQYKLDEN